MQFPPVQLNKKLYGCLWLLTTDASTTSSTLATTNLKTTVETASETHEKSTEKTIAPSITAKGKVKKNQAQQIFLQDSSHDSFYYELFIRNSASYYVFVLDELDKKRNLFTSDIDLQMSNRQPSSPWLL